MLVSAPAGFAQDAKKSEGPNASDIGANKPKADAKAQGVANLRMVADLVTYGRQAKSPMALIVAAKMLWATPVKTEGGSAKPVEGADDAGKAKADLEAVGPQLLLEEAKKLSGGDEHIDALIAEARRSIAERPRGEIDGPSVREAYLGPNGSGNWTAVFRANELASVTIAGYGGADFDLYVYDDRGNLIRQDTGPTTNATCTWVPSYTATYTFRVVNCSPFGSGYRFINN
ncbi:MAG: hypothetical protein U0800_17140 [Isosphaeraceae bacterium]